MTYVTPRGNVGEPALVLGMNATHDAAAALVRGGEVVMAVEEERLSRVKHHFGVPLRAMGACTAAAGTTTAALEHVAFYMNARLWLASYGWHFVRHLPRSASYLGRRPALWRSFLGVERRLRQATGFRGRFHLVDHHVAHVDSAFYPSGFEEAAALSVDGAGESATTVLARVDERRQRWLRVRRYPVSLGKLWEAVTDWLGWQPTRDEGKVMGLAPYGTPRLVSAFSRVLAPRDDGSFHQDLAYTWYQYGAARLVSDRFVRVFGPPRPPDGELLDHHRDVAFALQRQTEEVVLARARWLRRETGLSRLVMAGGVALNCVANGRLVREGVFDEVFVQPAAGDNGASLGAALHVSHRRLGAARGPAMRHAFVGPGFTDEETVAAARERGLEVERPADVVDVTADLLARGDVVGWMQGRMEYGPRALGNRSILADPTRADAKERVNAEVKFRESFRPFAPSVPLEVAGDWFEGVRPSPYMLLAFPVRADCRARLPAVTHVDGSARVQTVTAEENPRFHALLCAFGRRSGVPVLLNTSFNVRGEPIVCTPGEALDALLRTGLAAVVVGELLFRRPG
jgi:carbamoyltransferase